MASSPDPNREPLPDTGGLTDSPDETTSDQDNDSIVPGDSSAIYERGTTIIPPG